MDSLERAFSLALDGTRIVGKRAARRARQRRALARRGSGGRLHRSSGSKQSKGALSRILEALSKGLFSSSRGGAKRVPEPPQLRVLKGV